MELLLKNTPILNIYNNGTCEILEFHLLPFPLRKKELSYSDFFTWAANRTIPIGRTHAKSILNSLHLSQTNHYAVFRACRGLNLTDSYWVKEEGDTSSWETINLFHHPISFYIAGIALTGEYTLPPAKEEKPTPLHTPELTTQGVSAKGWFREKNELYLYKIGKKELAADAILTALLLPHLSYQEASKEEYERYLTLERRDWLSGVGETLVKCKLFTSPDTSFVPFEEFQIFCETYGLDPFAEARNIDPASFDAMEIADYLLLNNDRHGQNWGFFMDNASGLLTNFVPLFDHDHAFSGQEFTPSQTSPGSTLYEAARDAMKQHPLDLSPLLTLPCPPHMEEKTFLGVQERARHLLHERN